MVVLSKSGQGVRSCAALLLLLSLCPGGKQLVLHGGQSRTHESVARETAVLSLDTLQ